MNENHIDLNARLEAHAILDRLVADGPTFPVEDARRLIDLIPMAPGSRISFIGVFRRRGPGAKGHAAGIIFIAENGEGPGVRLKKQKPDEGTRPQQLTSENDT